MFLFDPRPTRILLTCSVSSGESRCNSRGATCSPSVHLLVIACPISQPIVEYACCSSGLGVWMALFSHQMPDPLR